MRLSTLIIAAESLILSADPVAMATSGLRAALLLQSSFIVAVDPGAHPGRQLLHGNVKTLAEYAREQTEARRLVVLVAASATMVTPDERGPSDVLRRAAHQPGSGGTNDVLSNFRAAKAFRLSANFESIRNDAICQIRRQIRQSLWMYEGRRPNIIGEPHRDSKSSQRAVMFRGRDISSYVAAHQAELLRSRLSERPATLPLYFITDDQLARLAEGSQKATANFNWMALFASIAATLFTSIAFAFDNFSATHSVLCTSVVVALIFCIGGTITSLVRWRTHVSENDELLKRIRNQVNQSCLAPVHPSEQQ